MRAFAWIGCVCFAVSGCMLANMTPKARFQDAAYTLNDAARWGQVDTASLYVSPKYLPTYVSRHRLWGDQVSIADADLVRLQMGKQGGATVVTLAWYDTHGVTLRTTTIAQTWETEHGNYKLVSEKISAGDPSIFAEAEETTNPAPAAADQPAAPASEP
jgi:hypothetical protein